MQGSHTFLISNFHNFQTSLKICTTVFNINGSYSITFGIKYNHLEIFS